MERLKRKARDEYKLCFIRKVNGDGFSVMRGMHKNLSKEWRCIVCDKYNYKSAGKTKCWTYWMPIS